MDYRPLIWFGPIIPLTDLIFKLKAKHPLKSHIIRCVSCTSPFVTLGPILGSHVFAVTYTLGWDDGTSPTFQVEGMACDCYAKYGKVPSCPSTPKSSISSSTPINVPWHPWSHNCQGCTCLVVCLRTTIVDLAKGATSERWGGMGGCDWPKWYCFAKTKLKIHVKQLRSITCPKIRLWVLSKMPCIVMVLVWTHGPFLFICIGFFHTGWMGDPIHHWIPIPKCMKMWKI